MKVEVAVLALIVLMVSVDVKQHSTGTFIDIFLRFQRSSVFRLKRNFATVIVSSCTEDWVIITTTTTKKKKKKCDSKIISAKVTTVAEFRLCR